MYYWWVLGNTWIDGLCPKISPSTVPSNSKLPKMGENFSLLPKFHFNAPSLFQLVSFWACDKVPTVGSWLESCGRLWIGPFVATSPSTINSDPWIGLAWKSNHLRAPNCKLQKLSFSKFQDRSWGAKHIRGPQSDLSLSLSLMNLPMWRKLTLTERNNYFRVW